MQISIIRADSMDSNSCSIFDLLGKHRRPRIGKGISMFNTLSQKELVAKPEAQGGSTIFKRRTALQANPKVPFCAVENARYVSMKWFCLLYEPK